MTTTLSPDPNDAISGVISASGCVLDREFVEITVIN
jgi:hypothetical protein